MPSGTRDAEWHVKRKSAGTKRSKFSGTPRSGMASGDGFQCMGYLFEKALLLSSLRARQGLVW